METAALVSCTSCGADDVHPAQVSSAFWHDGRLVVVEGIPALKCARCGEQFFDDGAVVVIDLLRGQGFDESAAQSHIRVPVFSFAEALAIARTP